MTTDALTGGGAVGFMLSGLAFSLLGLDDHGLVAETYPTLKSVGRDSYTASEKDARSILDMLDTRAAGDSGFEHTGAERRELGTWARRLRIALYDITPEQAAVAALPSPSGDPEQEKK